MIITALSILTIVLFFTVVFYLAKAKEAAEEGMNPDDRMEKTSDTQGKLFLLFMIVGLFLMFYMIYSLAPRMLPDSASIHGDLIDNMFNVTTVVALLVVLLTQSVLFYFAFKYRFKKNRTSYFFPHNNTFEAIWTIIPAIVLTFLVFRGINAWNRIFDFKSLENNEKVLIFHATAKQFGWTLRYPGPDGEFGKRIIDKEHISPTNELGVNWEDKHSHDDFYSDELVLVKGRPTIAKLSSLDVLHGFYLPHFRVKMDCVPGMPTQFMFTPKYTTEEYKEMLSKKKYWQQINPETGNPKWKDFTFELACTEMCGKSHFAMQRNVRVVTEEEYEQWVEENKMKSYYYTVINPDAIKKVEMPEDLGVENDTISVEETL